MKRAREIGELQRQELELDKSRLDREAKSLRAEVVDLQRRLEAEQREALKLQAEVKRENKAVDKLGQCMYLEDRVRSCSHLRVTVLYPDLL